MNDPDSGLELQPVAHLLPPNIFRVVVHQLEADGGRRCGLAIEYVPFDKPDRIAGLQREAGGQCFAIVAELIREIGEPILRVEDFVEAAHGGMAIEHPLKKIGSRSLGGQ